jgi:hypothetical protein
MKKLFVIMMIVTGWAAFAQQGTIQDTTGTVEIKQAGAASFTAAKQGDPVAGDTVISTGFKSSATIRVGSSTIVVRHLTRLSFAEISSSQGAEQVNLDLHTGRVRVDVKPPAGTKVDFSVRGPTATASVRGTSFDFDTINLTVNEGTVAYSGARGRPMMVSAGSASRIDPLSGRPVDPIVSAAANLLPPAPMGVSAANTPAPAPAAPPVLADPTVDVTVTFPR